MSLLAGLKVVRAAFARTVRLVSTATLRRAVMSALVEDEDLAALAEIEGATSGRLIAEHRGGEGLGANELVYGVPHARFINAAFAYARPRELNRFNGPDRGAWYAALEVETCLGEVAFHMADFLGRTGDRRAVVDYVEMHASLAGEFVDLRGEAGHASLNPDPALGYPAGNAVAEAARARGLNGLIYPSIRHTGGTCFAALWPHAVQSVAPGDRWRMTWTGDAAPSVERV
ncbi:MAG: RES family NAD+ phosphorylase [Caulobacteraceae bacterium]